MTYYSKENKPRKPRCSEEHQIQSAIVSYLRAKKITVFAVPNGINFNTGMSRERAAIYMKNLKDEGFTPGVSDLIIIRPYPEYPVYVEVKTKTGTFTPSQKEWKERMSILGWDILTWRSIDDAINWDKTEGVNKWQKKYV